jgi:hypothetical protein
MGKDWRNFPINMVPGLNCRKYRAILLLITGRNAGQENKNQAAKVVSNFIVLYS